MWQPNGYLIINLKAWIQIAHAVRQNIAIFIVGPAVIVDFKTLKPFSCQLSILTQISSSCVSSTRVYFDQEWSKKKEKPRWFRLRSNKYFHVNRDYCQHQFQDFEALYSPILAQISSSFGGSTRMYFDQRWNKKKASGPKADPILNNFDYSLHPGKIFGLCTTPLPQIFEQKTIAWLLVEKQIY